MTSLAPGATDPATMAEGSLQSEDTGRANDFTFDRALSDVQHRGLPFSASAEHDSTLMISKSPKPTILDIFYFSRWSSRDSLLGTNVEYSVFWLVPCEWNPSLRIPNSQTNSQLVTKCTSTCHPPLEILRDPSLAALRILVTSLT